jgi:hypothetical protein
MPDMMSRAKSRDERHSNVFADNDHNSDSSSDNNNNNNAGGTSEIMDLETIARQLMVHNSSNNNHSSDKIKVQVQVQIEIESENENEIKDENENKNNINTRKLNRPHMRHFKCRTPPARAANPFLFSNERQTDITGVMMDMIDLQLNSILLLNIDFLTTRVVFISENIINCLLMKKKVFFLGTSIYTKSCLSFVC